MAPIIVGSVIDLSGVAPSTMTMNYKVNGDDM